MLRVRKFILSLSGVLLLLHSVIPHIHSGNSEATATELHAPSCEHDAFSLTSLFAHNHSSISSPDAFIPSERDVCCTDTGAPEPVKPLHPAQMISTYSCAALQQVVYFPSFRFLSCSGVRPPPVA